MEEKNKKFVLWFDEVRIEDTNLVGGKNAALGEMHSTLTPLGVAVPNGFALTAYAYKYFIEHNELDKKIYKALNGLDTHDLRDLQARGKKVRKLILSGKFPKEMIKEIDQAYKKLGEEYGENTDVAVRSSATAEDLPNASFAGQQDTYLNISGTKNLIDAARRCMSSLFTDRAISYREDQNFDHFKVRLSVGVQKMARSDLASSGIAFTIDTETGFDKVVVINSTLGLGEYIVQGKVIPDEWMVFKPTYKKGFKSIISKKIGDKKEKLIYKKGGGIKKAKIDKTGQETYSLTDEEVLKLAGWCLQIEEHFSNKKGHQQPMDIEWAKDGVTGELFIIQARPETVHSNSKKNIWTEYNLLEKVPEEKVITKGIAVGTKIATGKVHVIKSASQIHQFKKGEILVTEMTDPDWEPIMKIAGGIITDKGSRTSHAAIVSRELGIPCLVGTEDATKVLKNGQIVTQDSSLGSYGYVYEGEIKFEIQEHDLTKIPELPVKVMTNIGAPDEALKHHHLPIKGVGLAREEFIIASDIGFHPNALINYPNIDDVKLKKQIEKATLEYEDKKQFYIDKLARGISKISAAAWPYQAIVRFSDFKSNEYRTLPGGELYEPKEENPMIGWRGASRYYDEKFKEAFKLEVAALVKAREEFGMVNIVPMIPFCRTTKEAFEVVKILEENGWKRDIELIKEKGHLPVEESDHKRIYMMCEIPANVILAEQFLEIFDGYSIGSNDLTQLTLGLDRDAQTLAHVGNENNEAVKELIKRVIPICKEKGKYIGICGQAPSDIEGYAKFLMNEGIDSISLTPDTVIKTIMDISK